MRLSFYIVVKGRKYGMFYKWKDCLASVANFDQAVFFGVDSLEEGRTVFCSVCLLVVNDVFKYVG